MNQKTEKKIVKELKEELAELKEQLRLLDSRTPLPPYQDLTLDQRIQKIDETQARIMNTKSMIATHESQEESQQREVETEKMQRIGTAWTILGGILAAITLLWTIGH